MLSQRILKRKCYKCQSCFYKKYAEDVLNNDSITGGSIQSPTGRVKAAALISIYKFWYAY